MPDYGNILDNVFVAPPGYQLPLLVWMGVYVLPHQGGSSLLINNTYCFNGTATDAVGIENYEVMYISSHSPIQLLINT
jgi:hypothetical protein